MPTALLSVYHKNGIAQFAQGLHMLGWTIVASAGTCSTLSENGIPARDIAELVGPPILGHRVVTLSRQIHAGLLARDTPEDRAELEREKIPFIDLVCVDLYPLEEEIAKANSTPASILEKTDIGGPGLLRSAAKGRRIVICDPADRMRVLADLISHGKIAIATLLELASKAERTVARYCYASADAIEQEKSNPCCPML